MRISTICTNIHEGMYLCLLGCMGGTSVMPMNFQTVRTTDGRLSKQSGTARLTEPMHMQMFVNTIRVALDSVNPQVPFVDSSPSNQIEALDPYTKRYAPLQ